MQFNIAYRELRTYTFPNVLVMLKMQNKSFDRLLHKIPLFFSVLMVHHTFLLSYIYPRTI